MKQYNQNIRGKLFKYFEGKLGLKKSTKGWWRCDCVYCGGRYTFGIHLEDHHVKCFKCDHHANPIDLLIHIQGFETYLEAYKFLNVQQEYEAYDRMMIKKEKVETISMELPDSFKLLIHGDSIMGNAARNYIKGRGFDITKLSLQGVGYCTQGDYAGYIIFPYYRKGKLIYFQGRKYMGHGPKMHNPSEELYGIGKTSLIYNEDALYIYNKIYAMESITNSLTWGDSAIGLSGKDISPTQCTKIIQSPCEKLIIILDPDAIAQAYNLALQMVHFKMIKIVELPEGKDVNDLGKVETQRYIKQSLYLKYSDILKLKNKHNAKTGAQFTYQRIPSNYSSSRGAA